MCPLVKRLGFPSTSQNELTSVRIQVWSSAGNARASSGVRSNPAYSVIHELQKDLVRRAGRINSIGKENEFFYPAAMKVEAKSP